MSAAAILAVFFVFAVLMYARVVPALLAVPAMAVVMSVVAGVPPKGVAAVVVDGAASLASVYVAVVFGAMLGRVTLDTGIARSIVNFAAEFGGEQPPVVAMLMCAVVALLFVSLTGLGAIIMVGSIVLPIMMTTGVPRKIAATLFLMAFALGFIFNIAYWKFYTQYFGVTQQQMLPYAVALAAVDALALAIYAAVSFSRSRDYATWAVEAEKQTVRIPWFALVTPVLPILLYFTLHVDAVAAFALSAIYGALTTRPAAIVRILSAAAIRGVEDVAPAIVLFIGIGMLLTAVRQPEFAAALRPLVASDALRNPAAYVVLFGLLSPLVLYRGPLNPFGVGIAFFTVLLSAHVYPAAIIVAAIMAVVQVQNVCDPTNTANVWVANFTGVHIEEITKRTLPFQVAVATAACIAVVAASGPLLGVHGFGPVVQRAAAATMAPPGFFTGPQAAGRLAVGDDGSHDGRTAAVAAASLLDGRKVHAMLMQTNPNMEGCSRKPYAAYLQAAVTRFGLVEGTDVDVGLRLEDCGGWEVAEWHEHEIFAQPSTADVENLARQCVARLLDWSQSNAERWTHLLEQGAAYAASDPPAYYFSLFKTVDGNMRAYVRAGGPAYASGLRTGDVVNKIDGRYWWEYGTYQSQNRAYDGKPHTFEVQRGTAAVEIALGAPFPQ